MSRKSVTQQRTRAAKWLPVEVKTVAELLDQLLTTVLKVWYGASQGRREPVLRYWELAAAVDRRLGARAAGRTAGLMMRQVARWRQQEVGLAQVGCAPAGTGAEEAQLAAQLRRVSRRAKGALLVARLDSLAAANLACWHWQEAVFAPGATAQAVGEAAKRAHEANKQRCAAMRDLDGWLSPRQGVLAKTF